MLAQIRGCLDFVQLELKLLVIQTDSLVPCYSKLGRCYSMRVLLNKNERAARTCTTAYREAESIITL
jgi:hypothetical protein